MVVAFHHLFCVFFPFFRSFVFVASRSYKRTHFKQLKQNNFYPNFGVFCCCCCCQCYSSFSFQLFVIFHWKKDGKTKSNWNYIRNCRRTFFMVLSFFFFLHLFISLPPARPQFLDEQINFFINSFTKIYKLAVDKVRVRQEQKKNSKTKQKKNRHTHTQGDRPFETTTNIRVPFSFMIHSLI